jgi:hypothetical protein
VPTSCIQWFSNVSICECRSPTPRVVEHITLTAKLRGLERSGSEITVSITSGGFRGRVSAVWKDGVDVKSRLQTVTISLGRIQSITVDRA